MQDSQIRALSFLIIKSDQDGRKTLDELTNLSEKFAGYEELK